MNQIKSLLKEMEQQLALFVVIVVALAAFLTGILVWKISVIPVTMIVVLVGGMAVCLQRIAIGQHGIVVAAQIILGVICEKTLFLLICAFFYVICILALRFCRK